MEILDLEDHANISEFANLRQLMEARLRRSASRKVEARLTAMLTAIDETKQVEIRALLLRFSRSQAIHGPGARPVTSG
jgi:hypothetical protein